MNDPDAAPAVERSLGEKGAERKACLVLRHAVQVDLVADGVLAATQSLENGFGNAFAAIAELFAGFDVEIRRIQHKRIRKDPCLVGPAGDGAWPAALTLGGPLCLAQRPHVAHGGTEQFAFLVLDGGILRQCAVATGLTV